MLWLPVCMNICVCVDVHNVSKYAQFNVISSTFNITFKQFIIYLYKKHKSTDTLILISTRRYIDGAIIHHFNNPFVIFLDILIT